MDEFLVSIKLKHDSLDEIQHSNNLLVMLYGLIFDIPSSLGYKTIIAMYVKDCERHFHVLF